MRATDSYMFIYLPEIFSTGELQVSVVVFHARPSKAFYVLHFNVGNVGP